MEKLLDHKQRKELLAELQRERGRKHADRIRVILLLDQGKTYKSIAEHLFLDEGSIGNYRRRYKEGGLEALLSDDYKGSTSFLSINDQFILDTHISENIYLSIKAVLVFVQKRFKAKYSIPGLTSLLHRMGYSYKKPKPVPGKASITAQQDFLTKYEAIKEEGKVYFADSVHPHHNPIMGYGWIKTGVEMEIFTNPGRAHLNIAGALCLDNLEIITRNFETIDSGAICHLLHAIKDKNPEDKKLFLILDNARYHHAKKVKELALQLNITLVFLPGYSPNLNPIERLWKYFKKLVVYNTYYPEFDDFKKATANFFRGIRGRKKDLSTLLTDNFQILGT